MLMVDRGGANTAKEIAARTERTARETAHQTTNSEVRMLALTVEQLAAAVRQLADAFVTESS
jgi:hypothetical protein